MLVAKAPGLPVEFKEEYLRFVADWLLEEWYATEDDLVRDTDTAYTRGTARFGRQKQRLVNEAASRRHPWLDVKNNTNDLVFSIAGIPCRFTNDNADAPRKRATLEVHRFQMPLLEEAEPGQAARFVFVIDQGMDQTGEPRVLLLGYSAAGEEVCRWRSGGVARVLGDARAAEPAPVAVAKPVVTLKTRAADGDAAAASAGP